MSFRIARVPLTSAERVVSPGGVDLALRAFQPIVWVRAVPWVGPPLPGAVAFPAVVDTGNNHSFLIQAALFRAWTGADPRDHTPGRRLLVNGFPVQCFGFNLDLVRLRHGEPTDQTAARLQTGQGVAIIPDALAASFPRMPVLGIRCLTTNRITFSVNGGNRTFSLSQPT